MGKQRLFISYCWKDGNTYADELETQLKDTFDVKRDKSQLIANDNLYDFMAEIANCENVIIVLTAEYVKSLKCMLEMSYLVSQDEWGMKAMVLVIDDSLYSIERKFEVMNYWILRQKNNHASLKDADFGKALWEEEKEYIDLICENMEKFFEGLSRRKNPSQIAIVNEVIKKSQRSQEQEHEMRECVVKGEDLVKEFLAVNGNMTINELSEKMNRTRAATMRYISNLSKEGVIERVGDGKNGKWVLKKSGK